MKNTPPLKQMADDLGISIYQRFSETEAATFLNISKESLKQARSQKNIAFLSIGEDHIEFFGHQLLEYLIGCVSSPSLPLNTNDSLLRSKQVTKLTGLSRTTLWRMENSGDFPKRVSLGKHCVGWKSSEITEWINTRHQV